MPSKCLLVAMRVIGEQKVTVTSHEKSRNNSQLGCFHQSWTRIQLLGCHLSLTVVGPLQAGLELPCWIIVDWFYASRTREKCAGSIHVHCTSWQLFHLIPQTGHPSNWQEWGWREHLLARFWNLLPIKPSCDTNVMIFSSSKYLFWFVVSALSDTEESQLFGTDAVPSSCLLFCGRQEDVFMLQSVSLWRPWPSPTLEGCRWSYAVGYCQALKETGDVLPQFCWNRHCD